MPSVLPQDEMRATSYPQEVETQLNYRTKLGLSLTCEVLGMLLRLRVSLLICKVRVTVSRL